MKRKFLAKAIMLGLMLAVPFGVEAATVTTVVNNQTITKWGEQTVIQGGITNGLCGCAIGYERTSRNKSAGMEEGKML